MPWSRGRLLDDSVALDSSEEEYQVLRDECEELGLLHASSGIGPVPYPLEKVRIFDDWRSVLLPGEAWVLAGMGVGTAVWLVSELERFEKKV